MSTHGYLLFETAVGRCGLAWGEGGLLVVQLPERSDAESVARLIRRAPGAVAASPPASVADAASRIAALLAGQTADLSGIVLDYRGVPDFHRRVYEVARRIRAGQTATYGEVARLLGAPGAARAVGQALGRNPFAPVVPCHRVVAAGRAMGGFSAHGGVALKRRLLEIERGGGGRR